jgi:cell division protease FtsH
VATPGGRRARRVNAPVSAPDISVPETSCRERSLVQSRNRRRHSAQGRTSQGGRTADRSGDRGPLPLALLAGISARLGQRVSDALRGLRRQGVWLAPADDTGVTFADVAGCDAAVAELQEIVEFLQRPERYRALGARLPRAVLLVGPAGAGKTLVARAVAGEARVPFLSLSASDVAEPLASGVAALVHELFDQAQRSAPCVVLIDDLEALGRPRGSPLEAASDAPEPALHALLAELDDLEPGGDVIVLGATRHPDAIERALLRPGRFDRCVAIDAPDADGREALLRVHARGRPLDPGAEPAAIARATPGLCGADLASLVNQAALFAAREGARTITQAHLEAATEARLDPAGDCRRLSAHERRRRAYHEVGRAIVTAFTRGAGPLRPLSILPRAGVPGDLPSPLESARPLLARVELLARLRVLLGARAAEAIAFEDPSTGPTADLARATALARAMVTAYGMGRSVGQVHWARTARADGADAGERACSETTAREIDQEVRQLIDEAFAAARKLLADHRDDLETIAAELLLRETLDARRFRTLLDKNATHPA